MSGPDGGLAVPSAGSALRGTPGRACVQAPPPRWACGWGPVGEGQILTFLRTSSPFMCKARFPKCRSIWSVASCCSMTSSP